MSHICTTLFFFQITQLNDYNFEKLQTSGEYQGFLRTAREVSLTRTSILEALKRESTNNPSVAHLKGQAVYTTLSNGSFKISQTKVC